MTVAVPERLRQQAQHIANAKSESDLIGKGVAVVIRKALRAYVGRNRDLLPPELRD